MSVIGTGEVEKNDNVIQEQQQWVQKVGYMWHNMARMNGGEGGGTKHVHCNLISSRE